MNRVLVYGTLRPSYKGKPSGEVRHVRGVLYDLGWFPGIILASNQEDENYPLIVCEVLSVDDEELKGFDAYEGYNENDKDGSLYLRKTVVVDGEPFQIYEYNKTVLDRNPIEPDSEGYVDWVEHSKEVA